MTYRCVIVDDEKPARQRLRRLLSTHDDFEIVGEAPDADGAVALIDELEPDLCFLDVQMPEGNGFEVLRRVRKIPGVIFTTAFDQYAVQAFEVRSFDYLLKPFSRTRFAEALDRARGSLGRPEDRSEQVLELLREIRQGIPGPQSGVVDEPPPEAAAGETRPRRITAKRGAKIVLLDPDELHWFEAEETLVFACGARGRFLIERTLADLEQQFETEFFRAHRRFLINLAQIAEIVPGDAGTFEIVMRDKQATRLPLSRRQARKLKELIPW